MSHAKLMDRLCSDCDTTTRDRFFLGEKRGPSDYHGVSGWESDKPLCVECAKIRIWGPDRNNWPSGRKHKKASV